MTEPDRDGEDGGAHRPSDPFEPGAHFSDRFRIGREIAVGGMGTVYEATDLRNQRSVALKVLKRDRHPEPESRQRFYREAEILASMDHPGIVRIRGFGHAPDGAPWLAMELLEGETLLDRVRRQGPQAPQALVPIIEAASDALEAAHERGVVHRDLKPENLFLPAAGQPQVKILDFGLSQIAGSAKLTRTGTIIGTPRYMAPEQIRSARSADARVDIYALGVITYEALTGASPFTASDHGQLLGAILTGRRRSLGEVRPDLPEGLDDILTRALAPNPADRYVSVREFAEALTACAGRSAAPSQAASSPDEAFAGLAGEELRPSRSWAEPLDPSAFAPPEAAEGEAADATAPAPPGSAAAPRPRFSVPPGQVPVAPRRRRRGAVLWAITLGGALGLAAAAWAAVRLFVG